jgi:C_GCAxxG_C_C family probable redox protein
MVEIAPELVPSVATGFGGGLGRNGLVCGAVAAGTMIISIKGTGKGKKQVYPVVDRFVNDFKSRFGGVNCRELIGVDLKTEEGMAYLKEEGKKKCSEFVCYAADKTHEIVSSIDVFEQS